MVDLVQNNRLKCDVCIVGGGPAGAITAAELCKVGLNVVLVERQEFPRSHIGESIQSSIRPVLDRLGVLDIFESAGKLEIQPPIIKWANAINRFATQDEEKGILVDRARLDSLLLDRARESGVVVIQPGRPNCPNHVGTHCWTIDVSSPQFDTKIEARFLVDASGRANYLKGSSEMLGPKSIAMYSYWFQTEMNMACIESSLDEWFWGAPVPNSGFNATVFVDPERLQSNISIRDLYISCIRKSTLLSGSLNGSFSKVCVCDASNRLARESVGEDWIKVGEACFSLDPLSSQGIHAAIVTGVQAAKVIKTILSYPDDAPAAREFYTAATRRTALSSTRLATNFYLDQFHETPTCFWQRRAKSAVANRDPLMHLEMRDIDKDCVLALSTNAQFVNVAVLDYDRIHHQVGLSHPSLEEPIANYASIPLVKLLSMLPSNPVQLVYKWGGLLSHRAAVGLLQWLWRNRIVVSYTRPNS